MIFRAPVQRERSGAHQESVLASYRHARNTMCGRQGRSLRSCGTAPEAQPLASSADTGKADIAHDGTNGSGQPGPFWPEFLPGSGELRYRDRGGRELEPSPFERIRIASPGAGERAYPGHRPGRQANLCRSKIRFGPVTCGFWVGQAACVYSLIRPPRTGLRWIRAVSRSVTVKRGVSRSASGTC